MVNMNIYLWRGIVIPVSATSSFECTSSTTVAGLETCRILLFLLQTVSALARRWSDVARNCGRAQNTATQTIDKDGAQPQPEPK